MRVPADGEEELTDAASDRIVSMVDLAAGEAPADREVESETSNPDARGAEARGLSSACDERWPDARRRGPRVTDQFYVTTIAGIALSAAGFAGLVTALRGDGRWSKTELWRLRNLVQSALTLVVVSLLPSRSIAPWAATNR